MYVIKLLVQGWESHYQVMDDRYYILLALVSDSKCPHKTTKLCCPTIVVGHVTGTLIIIIYSLGSRDWSQKGQTYLHWLWVVQLQGSGQREVAGRAAIQLNQPQPLYVDMLNHDFSNVIASVFPPRVSQFAWSGDNFVQLGSFQQAFPGASPQHPIPMSCETNSVQQIHFAFCLKWLCVCVKMLRIVIKVFRIHLLD